MKSIIIFISIIAFATTTFCQNSKNNESLKEAKKKYLESYMNDQQIQFVKNNGQIANNKGIVQNAVIFQASINNAEVFFTADKIIFITREEYFVETEESKIEKEKGNLEYAKQLELRYKEYQFNLKFINPNEDVKIYGENECTNFSNYYLGHCQDGILNVPHYYSIYYENIYPNIDLKFYSNSKSLKFDFIVKPGANPNIIKYTYEYITDLSKTETGDINILTPLMNFAEEAPYSYTIENERITEVRSEFSISDLNIISFELDDYPKDQILIIDPTLEMIWSTYFDIGGSSTWDNIVFNSVGDFYAACYHSSSSVDVMNAGGFYQSTGGGSTDLAIVKFSNAGVQLWTTYYGGSGNEYIICNTSAVDSKDNFYLGGETSSTSDFPLQNAGGYYDGSTTNTCGFLLKFNNSTSRLWSTYIGASGARVRGITTDVNDDVYIVGGCSNTASLPVQDQGGGSYYQATHAGGENGYIFRFDQNTNKLWCTYFGGNCYVNFQDIKIDPTNNNLYCVGELGGWSVPTSYPPLTNPGGGAYFDNTVNGKQDLFIARFNSSRALTWSTIYGGQYNDNINGDCGTVDTDSDGNVYICGKTMSDNLPIQDPGSGAYYQSSIGNNGIGDSENDGFILKFNTSAVRQWATYYGGSGSEEIRKLKIDNNNYIWFAGYTTNSTIPLLSATDHYNQTYGGSTSDAFVGRFSPTGVREWVSCLGGSGNETCRPFNIYEPNSSTVELFMVDYTNSLNFPTVDAGGGAYYISSRPTASSSYITKFSYKTCVPSTPPTSATANPTSVCSGVATDITLTASGGTLGDGAVTQWYTGSCGGTFVGTGNPLTVSQTLSSATTYYARYSGDCGTTTCANTTVNVDPLPTAAAGGSQTICVNETATVSGASASNGTIAWTENGAGSITSGATTLTPTYTPAAGDAGNTVTLTMTVTSDNSCTGETVQATYTVNVDPLPTAAAGGSQTICVNETATVSGASASN
ncbi:MAG TPA: hypothetical protein PKN32_09675, partial [Bacteroidales bacterium]|nr:hypothetical protein [Bacteroidales bacterium]